MALHVKAALLYILIPCSVLPNAVVIIIFLKIQPRLQLNDILLVSLALSDCLRGLIGYIPDVSMIYGIESDSTTDPLTCRITGFTISFLAYVSIAHMIVIPLDRMINIAYPSILRQLQDNCRRLGVILIVWTYGIIFAIIPFLGASSYKRDSNICSLDWRDHSFSGKFYLMSLFVFCYLLPIVTISVSFHIIQRKLQQMVHTAQHSFGTQHLSVMQNLKAQKGHIKMILVMITIFFAAWTPYAVVSFMMMLDIEIATTLVWVSAFVGKCTTIVNPLVYCFLYGKYRDRLRGIFRKRRSTVNPEINTTSSRTRPAASVS